MQYEVEMREATPQPLAAAQGYGHAQNYVKQLFALLDEVWKFLRSHPQVQHQGLNVFLYYGAADQDLRHTAQGMPLAAGVLLAGPFEGAGKVISLATPGGTVATTVHIGPYEQLGAAYAALNQWCHDNHRHGTGTFWEIYGHWSDDPDKLRTDIFYLLAE